MSGKIFISYRVRERAIARNIYERLIATYGRDVVFFDVESISPGDDWKQAIGQALKRCSVVLAVITPRWLEDLNERAQSRPEETDYVLLELSTALRTHTPIVNVITEGASLPRDKELPRELEGLSNLQALDLNLGSKFKSSMDVLAQTLEKKFELKPVCVSNNLSSRGPDIATILQYVALALLFWSFYQYTRSKAAEDFAAPIACYFGSLVSTFIQWRRFGITLQKIESSLSTLLLMLCALFFVYGKYFSSGEAWALVAYCLSSALVGAFSGIRVASLLRHNFLKTDELA